MSYIRLSLMKPRVGEEDRVRHLLDDLVMFHESQPGYLVGYRVEHTVDGDRVGRIAIWEHEHDADRAAQAEHDLAVRAQLNTLLVEGSHEEQTLYGHYAPAV